MAGVQGERTTGAAASGVRFSEGAGRWVLLATTLGSAVAFLDSTVVNIALPAIGKDLDTGLTGLQWTVNGYTLTLAALILLGGTLGDRFGRRRIFVLGAIWFAAASLLCAVSPTVEMLVAARALQGTGGALMTPGSLAIISASFHPDDRDKAIGAWAGFSGLGAAIGPFVGGYLIDALGWRSIFLINLPLAAIVIFVAWRHVPESREVGVQRRIDVPGAVLGAAALAGITYGFIEMGSAVSATAVAALAVGVAGMIAFVVAERRQRDPMVPLDIFRSRQFTAANIVTLFAYAALSGTFFFLVLYLQEVAGYSPLGAGAALLPVTAFMLAGSAQAGALAHRIGPRLPMTIGPLIAATGVLLLLRLDSDAPYVTQILPPMVLFGIGLTLMVSPLTATVMGAVPGEHAGAASGINNAVARTAGLLAVAVLPIVAGLSGDDYRNPGVFSDAFDTAMIACAALLTSAGALAWLTIRNPAAGDVHSAGTLDQEPHPNVNR